MEQKMQMMAEKMQLLLPLPPNDNDILPNDIVIEILSWLPAKSLLRFRWACKYWFDLITANHDDDIFIKMHLHRSTIISSSISSSSSSVLSFCFLTSNKLSQGHYYLNYNYTNDTTPPHVVVTSEVNECTLPENFNGILGSSNGLILLLIDDWFENTCIFNPCTKEYRLIPSPPPSLDREVNMDNNYDVVDDDDYDYIPSPPSIQQELDIRGDIYGFGYDQTINDYKVIRIISNIDGLSEVHVYTLGTNSWRRIILSSLPYGLRDCWTEPGVFLNGVLYWINWAGKYIVSFDIGKEKFHPVLKTPDLLDDRLNYSLKLQVFEGSLCLLLTINPVAIWVMKDVIVSNNTEALWTKLLTLPNLDYYSTNLLKILRYTRNGEMLMLKDYKDLVLYDPKNTSCQSLGKFCGSEENRRELFLLQVYTESLVSLNSGTYIMQ